MTRNRVLAGALVVAVAVAVVIAVANPFGSSPPASSANSGVATSTSAVERRDLSQQTQQSATLGYAHTATIAIPPGTAPTAIQQAQAQSDSAAQTAQAAQATLADDQLALSQARAAWNAGRRKLAADCNGDGAAGQATTPCASDTQAAATACCCVAAAASKVAAAQTAAGAAGQSLASAQTSASTYGQTSSYTMLPPVGRIVRRGEPLYAIDGQPTLLLYGATPPSRAFQPGMSPGRDVAELNANLAALGYGGLAGDAFTSGTQSAIEALQAKHGMPVTGKLLLGSVTFQPSAVRVTSVTPTIGGPVQAGPVLAVTSTKRVVVIQLDAASQSSVRVGDAVVITLPDNSTTPGHVSFVGTVATTPASSGSSDQSSSPTIEVDVAPDHPAATGRLDQAPVDVSITTQTVRNVLAVRVEALLALAGGGYALEVVGPGGVHHLEAVQLGLFDDAEGLVQVSGPSVRAGQRVVVPSST